jgi:four helix bundle protein
MAFYHEKLAVYQKALAFVGWTQGIIEKCPKKLSVRDQLERASESIVLNIAEGNGKFSLKDRARFFQISHGSTLECGGCLDLLVARGACKSGDISEPKAMLEEIVKMLCGLLTRFGVRLTEQVGFESESERQKPIAKMKGEI